MQVIEVDSFPLMGLVTGVLPVSGLISPSVGVHIPEMWRKTIREYSTTGTVVIGGMTIVPRSLTYRDGWFYLVGNIQGNLSTLTFRAPDSVKELLSDEWVKIPTRRSMQISLPKQLLPVCTQRGEVSTLTWEEPVRLRSTENVLYRLVGEVKLSHLDLYEDHLSVEFSGLFGKFVSPRIDFISGSEEVQRIAECLARCSLPASNVAEKPEMAKRRRKAEAAMVRYIKTCSEVGATPTPDGAAEFISIEIKAEMGTITVFIFWSLFGSIIQEIVKRVFRSYFDK